MAKRNVPFWDTDMDGDMSQNEVERFLGRLITDATFRSRLEESLEKACHDEGFRISRSEMSLLRGLDLQLIAQLAETIDDSIRRT